MSKIIDKRDIQESLDRAAWLSVHGSPEDKQGRSGGSVADTAMRLRNEMRIVTANWAMVEAFNAKFEAFRDDLVVHAAWQAAKFSVRAVARDTIMTLMRLTDGSGSKHELQTFSAIVGAFDGKTPLEIVRATGATEAGVQYGLAFLRERVPMRWGKNEDVPSNRELTDIRETLRPIRDRLIAHAMVHTSIDLRRDMPQVRAFLRITAELSDAVCLVCNVPRDDLQARWDAAFDEATRFWEIVAAGSRNSPKA